MSNCVWFKNKAADVYSRLEPSFQSWLEEVAESIEGSTLDGARNLPFRIVGRVDARVVTMICQVDQGRVIVEEILIATDVVDEIVGK